MPRPINKNVLWLKVPVRDVVFVEVLKGEHHLEKERGMITLRCGWLVAWGRPGAHLRCIKLGLLLWEPAAFAE